MFDECTVTTSLTTETLARRLGELALAERRVQVEFLLHLDEFDRRRAYLEAGYGSLWEYCLGALHLREGAAGRRIGAMRVLRRFPALTEPLRDGRLCLSTVSLLGQVLTNENLDELVTRAAHKTKEEVDHLVATLRPRSAPRDGIRQLPNPSRVSPHPWVSTPSLLGPTSPAAVPSALPTDDVPHRPTVPHAGTTPAGTVEEHCKTDYPVDRGPSTSCSIVSIGSAGADRNRPLQVRAVSETQWSLTVTLDFAAKKDLELLGALLSHKCGRNISAVLREAIRCGLEKHGKRRGAVSPQGKRKAPSPNDCAPAATGRAMGTQVTVDERHERSRSIPAEVRRQVFQRDGGSCTWIGHGGRRCGSRHQLEVDHVRPFELGGLSSTSNLRLLCKAHNLLYAEQVFGREHIAQFRMRDAGARSLERATHGNGSPPRAAAALAPARERNVTGNTIAGG